MEFSIEKKMVKGLGRAGLLTTNHGAIKTPAFVSVGTKATVKAVTTQQLKELGAQVVLANTYHLYLQPGESVLKQSGGLHSFMNWAGPTMTDSGGFQAFSLGAAFGKGISKISKTVDITDFAFKSIEEESDRSIEAPLAKITEEGVEFRSIINGSKHFFSPERSIEIQQAIGADIIFAFDECTAPSANRQYQIEAMERTHRWAGRSLQAHKKSQKGQAIFGIVQGGQFDDLRKQSAQTIGSMDFDGFGIGGSFTKEDIKSVVALVNENLPEHKPRHLLGIGEPLDLFEAVENGCDTFDCVAPTRIARNAALYTRSGRINILNSQYVSDFLPIDSSCHCYTCTHYSRAYISHLFRSKEILANTLASIHNLYFIIHLVQEMREAILDDSFASLKEIFFKSYLVGR